MAIIRYKKQWGKKIDDILRKTGFMFLLAYKDEDSNDWNFIIEEEGKLKRLSYKDFINLFEEL